MLDVTVGIFLFVVGWVLVPPVTSAIVDWWYRRFVDPPPHSPAR